MHHSPKPQSSAGRSRHLRYVAIALATILGLGACASEPTALHVSEVAGSTAPGTADPEDGASAAELIYERLSNPPRTVVKDGLGQVAATFTDGARTVVVTGAERTFEESTATEATVTTTNWVRLAPREWSKGAEREDWFQPWFDAARRSKAKDVLGIAFEYVEGAPDGSKDGLRIKGDASFGPPNKTGSGRLEANDFYDYLGIDWKFSDVGTERAEARRYGSLDCSGYWRMVLGYRMGLKLRGSNDPGAGLPRRAYAIAEHGPGVVVVPDKGRTATDYDALQIGDLVFFETENGGVLDHMGMYLGLDSFGQHRFLSSRAGANGPTMGDIMGTSVLDDDGFYSRAWYTARRI